MTEQEMLEELKNVDIPSITNVVATYSLLENEHSEFSVARIMAYDMQKASRPATVMSICEVGEKPFSGQPIS